SGEDLRGPPSPGVRPPRTTTHLNNAVEPQRATHDSMRMTRAGESEPVAGRIPSTVPRSDAPVSGHPPRIGATWATAPRQSGHRATTERPRSSPTINLLAFSNNTEMYRMRRPQASKQADGNRHAHSGDAPGTQRETCAGMGV